MATFGDNIKRIEQAKTDIKQAIESKGVDVGDGLIDTYADKILEIKEAGETQTKTITITENNSNTSVEPDEGYVGLEKVVVNTEIPMQGKDVSYNSNGHYAVYPDGEYGGMSYVGVNVNVPIQEKKTVKITSNDVHNILPDYDYDGMYEVEVEVEVKEKKKTVLPNGICLSGSTWETFDATQYDWSEIRDMGSMFEQCRQILSLDLSDANLSNVLDMSLMFRYCTKLKEVKMGGDVSKVENVEGMFDATAQTTNEAIFYYNPKYDYSKIIAELPSTWTAVPME